MSEEKYPQQLTFVRKVKELLPPNRSLVDELADLLQVSTDSAYRRIRGETAISIDECVKICQYFKIPFDYFNLDASDSVTFHYSSLLQQKENFSTYFKNIVNDLENINKHGKKEIIFAAEDIPIFHHFNYPSLTAFKIFYWNRSVINAPSYDGKKFQEGSVSDDLIKMGKKIFDTYCQIPSVEIWNTDTIVSTLRQIQFFWESGLFGSKELALQVCDDFEKELQLLQLMAEKESKWVGRGQEEGEKNFTLYNSEIMIGANSILVSTDETRSAYLAHHSFNSMVTRNHAYCEETSDWLKNLIRKSTLISGVAEKQRYQFFQSTMKVARVLKEKISNE